MLSTVHSSVFRLHGLTYGVLDKGSCELLMEVSSRAEFSVLSLSMGFGNSPWVAL